MNWLPPRSIKIFCHLMCTRFRGSFETIDTVKYVDVDIYCRIYCCWQREGKLVTLSGGCAPEESSLLPVTVSHLKKNVLIQSFKVLKALNHQLSAIEPILFILLLICLGHIKVKVFFNRWRNTVVCWVV